MSLARRNPKRSKYRAVPTVVDGIRFDSKKEAQRYAELKLLEKAKQITHLELQPEFPLYVLELTVQARLGSAARRPKGLEASLPKTLIGKWRGDFRYRERGLSASENERWNTIVEDVKGFKTPLYRWKKKHVEAQYGIVIREI